MSADATPSGGPRGRHLVLIGMMGSGKSTVGRILAERTAMPVVDTDVVIEQRTGRTVREIFAAEGEAAFRALESSVLADALAAPTPSIIAAAGGVVLSAENRRLLTTSGARVVWLRADPAVLVDRVRSGGHRPLLDDDPEGTLRRMAVEREPLYLEVAHAVVSVDGRTPAEVADAVLR